LKKKLVYYVTMDDFETDNLGTFSGNTSGKDPLTTLRAKCDHEELIQLPSNRK
jgi:hypothetical protein